MNPHRKLDPVKGVLPPDPEPKDDNEAEIEMSLRLMCSMSGNRSKAFWEDVTDSTPMTVVLNQAQMRLDNKYNLDKAEVRQDSSTAIDLKTLDRGDHRGDLPDFEDRSPGSVQFTSLVSASFWLVYCPNWMSSDVISLVDQIYKVRRIYVKV